MHMIMAHTVLSGREIFAALLEAHRKARSQSTLRSAVELLSRMRNALPIPRESDDVRFEKQKSTDGDVELIHMNCIRIIFVLRAAGGRDVVGNHVDGGDAFTRGIKTKSHTC